MHFLYRLLTPANTHIGSLLDRFINLINGIEEECKSADHCLQIMLSSLGAYRFLGEIFFPELLREQDRDHHLEI
jgi:hypothetical protein